MHTAFWGKVFTFQTPPTVVKILPAKYLEHLQNYSWLTGKIYQPQVKLYQRLASGSLKL